MWKILKRIAKNDNNAEVSFFDVKELYEAAYAEKARVKVNLKRFKALLSKAERLDEVYRAQLGLAQATRYGRAA